MITAAETPAALRKLLLLQALGSVAVNFPLNGALAWLSFPPDPSLPVWARSSCVGADTIGTSFFLPLITCLVATTLLRRLVRAGGAPALSRSELPRAVRSWPQNLVARGALVGLASVLTAAPAMLLILALAGVESMTRPENALYKAVYCSLLGIVVTPLLAWRALADAASPDGAR